MGCVLSIKKHNHHDHQAKPNPPPAPPATSSQLTTAAETLTLTLAGRTSLPGGIPPSPGDPLGWPPWLLAFAGQALAGLTPRRADSFQKLSKIGSGTYSNVYKATELSTGRVVAMKKVRFEAGEKESIKFMAREIEVLRKIGDHPNIVKFEGVVVSRVSHALYLVFEYMEHDLAGLAANPGTDFSEEQIKCYMHQLFTGLSHLHSLHILHRDIKGSNLLVNNHGVLKIADFGLAAVLNPAQKLTSRVVTLWYRAPELLLGATRYGTDVDMWSAGCILAEMFWKKPVLPGRTEVEQLHRIFKLCGSPSDKYWKKHKLPHATIVKPQEPYKRCIFETFKDFPSSSLSLIDKLLSLDPSERGTASDALNSEFFTTKPYACDPSSLPKYPPSKEMDAKLREEKSRRQKALDKRENNHENSRNKRATNHYRRSKAVPIPEANAELQVNLHRKMYRMNETSKSEKFPPPHQDGAVGVKMGNSHALPLSFIAMDTSFTSTDFTAKRGRLNASSQVDDSRNLMKSLMMDLRRNGSKLSGKRQGKEIDVFSGGK